jgi:hypothetical protein
MAPDIQPPSAMPKSVHMITAPTRRRCARPGSARG